MWFNAAIDISLSGKYIFNLLLLPCFWATWATFRLGLFFRGGGRVVARKNVALLLQENASSEEHVVYVWDHFVSKAEAKNVFIVAHSYGGLSFVELVSPCFSPLSLLSCVSPPTKPHR